MKIVKILSLALALIMFAGLCISCKINDSSNDTTLSAVQTTQSPSEIDDLYDVNGFLKDDIDPTTNLDGKTITILYWDDCPNQEFFSEKATGESVNDAIFSRNAKVQERLNVEMAFVGVHGNYDNTDVYLQKVKASVDQEYDIYSAHSATIAVVTYNGYCRNLLDYDVIDFEKPWWPDTLIDEATIGDKLYFASGDISTNMLYMMYGCYFNKNIIENYNLDNPYDLVKSNEWTLEKFYEMAESISIDITNITEDTVKGFSCTSQVHLDPFFVGSNLKTVDHTSDGSLQISPDFGSSKAQGIVEEVCSFLNSTGNYQNNVFVNDSKRFDNGNSLFTFNTAAYAFNYLKSLDVEYGIVPTPKYDEDQEDYSTLFGFSVSLYSISKQTDLGIESAVLLECLGSEGYRTITPVLFEECMKYKYAKDDVTSQMFDIIRNTVCFDVGRLYCKTFNRLTFSLYRDCVQKNNTGYLTLYNSNESFLKTTLDTIVTNIEKDQ